MVGVFFANNFLKLQNFFLAPLELSLQILPGHIKRKKILVINDKKEKEKVFIFQNGDCVSGTLYISLKHGGSLEHNGIQICLKGEIVSASSHYVFLTYYKDLEPPGIIYEAKGYNWSFNSIETLYDSYDGHNITVRYYVKLIINKSFGSPEIEHAFFAIQNSSEYTGAIEPLQMEVGIDECLLLEFVYYKSAYDLRDIITGYIKFKLVRLKVKCMEVNIDRVEIENIGNSQENNMETVAKFEVMDGSPFKNLQLPVKIYLAGYPLTPSYDKVCNIFSVKYYLNLVLIDEENQRYFKRQEIIFYRKPITKNDS